jgi:protocatechuate 3,4-dioxygenase beta subunit
MQRKEFLKRLSLSTFVLPLVAACSGDDDPTPTEAANTSSTSSSSSSGSTGTSATSTCTTSPSETAGPFPTKDPSSLAIADIRSDRKGVDLSVIITIQNKNNNCNALQNAIVDIWHCDKDGYYSEYGGTGMQSANFTSVHFLRGRQTANADGNVAFKTIFPGWYSGRAPHIHVHVYDSNGNSLLVTQIAFPTDVCNTVYTTATQYYTRGKQDTSNSQDSVFSDSLSQELASVSGNITDGYQLSYTIVVNA